ncbi:MAG: gamma-glutamyl-gamma-aminobutyrate hydrolase family protein [Acidimicrobiales bacterium]
MHDGPDAGLDPRSKGRPADAVIPLVGISTYVADTAWGTWRRPSAVLPETYYELVASAGARPLLLPPPRTAAAGPGFGAPEVIAVLDGLVLTGGGDVDPTLYGQAADASVGGVDPVRDESERALLAAALAVDLPVLAVCRGCQILNVELGGTLHQHLPDVVGHEGHRRAPSVFDDVEVTTVPGTRTAAVFGANPTVLCSHHQSIEAPGRGLVVTARSADGVIEAVEVPGSSFVLGVQWHPEESGDPRPFAALVAAALDYRAGRMSSAPA